MRTVASMADHREKNSPHIAGTVICLECRKESVGVAKAEAHSSFDCPHCGTGLAIFKYPTPPAAGTEILECGDCGSEVFYVLRAGLHCWRCGSVREFPA